MPKIIDIPETDYSITYPKGRPNNAHTSSHSERNNAYYSRRHKKPYNYFEEKEVARQLKEFFSNSGSTAGQRWAAHHNTHLGSSTQNVYKQPRKSVFSYLFWLFIWCCNFALISAIFLFAVLVWENSQGYAARQDQEYKQQVQHQLDNTRRYHQHCTVEKAKPNTLEYILGGCAQK